MIILLLLPLGHISNNDTVCKNAYPLEAHVPSRVLRKAMPHGRRACCAVICGASLERCLCGGFVEQLLLVRWTIGGSVLGCDAVVWTSYIPFFRFDTRYTCLYILQNYTFFYKNIEKALTSWMALAKGLRLHTHPHPFRDFCSFARNVIREIWKHRNDTVCHNISH